MLDVFIAELPTIFTDSEPNSMTTRAVICTRVLGIESLDWIAAFYADWHLASLWVLYRYLVGERAFILEVACFAPSHQEYAPWLGTLVRAFQLSQPREPCNITSRQGISGLSNSNAFFIQEASNHQNRYSPLHVPDTLLTFSLHIWKRYLRLSKTRRVPRSQNIITRSFFR